jgi:hypothetical protein
MENTTWTIVLDGLKTVVAVGTLGLGIIRFKKETKGTKTEQNLLPDKSKLNDNIPFKT